MAVSIDLQDQVHSSKVQDMAKSSADPNAKATPPGTQTCPLCFKVVRFNEFEKHKAACMKKMVVAAKKKKTKKENCRNNKATKK
ncbi:hypothetical protein FRX31_034022 [Thalictrum thalictroides]|uniref:Uncharacterized protein n=1 Tax=Thalictrum thalictroides TaxID=46969 RepID=A0A7J6UVA2_THATH|nr:hypothetical protein FRX31_034022 [Thalictrum thalictroides]